MSDMVAGLWLPDDNLSYVSCRLFFLSTGNYYNKVKVKVSFDNETCTIARVNALWLIKMLIIDCHKFEIGNDFDDVVLYLSRH